MPTTTGAALGDIRSQLDALVRAGFVSATGLERLRHLPRYLEAINVRVRKLVENPGRDRQAMNQLEPVQRELLWLAYAQGSSHEEIAGILGLRTISVIGLTGKSLAPWASAAGASWAANAATAPAPRRPARWCAAPRTSAHPRR